MCQEWLEKTFPKKQERITTLQRNQHRSSSQSTGSIRTLDDIFINLKIKSRGISRWDILSRIRRKLVGSIDLDNLGLIVTEINEIWAGKRKLSFSVMECEKESLTYEVIYGRMVKKDQPDRPKIKEIRRILSDFIPVRFEI